MARRAESILGWALDIYISAARSEGSGITDEARELFANLYDRGSRLAARIPAFNGGDEPNVSEDVVGDVVSALTEKARTAAWSARWRGSRTIERHDVLAAERAHALVKILDSPLCPPWALVEDEAAKDAASAEAA